MADEEKEGEAPKGKSKVMLIVVAVNVIAIGGVGAFMFLGGAEGGAGEASAAEPAMEMTEPAVTVPMDPFVVNLYEPGGGRYLKMAVEFEVPGEKGTEIVKMRQPMIRHSAIAYLSGLTFADTQGVEQKEAIREELKKRANEVLRRDVVRNVYFTDFIIQ